MSLIAVFLWFIGNGTYSVEYQNAWIMWYSVNYQGFTIPLMWLCLAFILKLFYEDMRTGKAIFLIAGILIASVLMTKIHATEFLYFLIFLIILSLINIRRVFTLNIRVIIIAVIGIIAAILITFVLIKYFLPEYKIIAKKFSSIENMNLLIGEISKLGKQVVPGLNRFPNSFTEIAIMSLIAMVIFRVNFLFARAKDISFNRSCYDFLLAASFIFFLIPIVPFLAGTAAFLTYPQVVYRFFFASPWFIFLPFVLYKFLTVKEIQITFYKLVISILLLIFSIVSFHKYLYPDAVIRYSKSIISSIDNRKVGVQYSKSDMAAIGEIIKRCEAVYKEKPNIYFTGQKSHVTGGAGDKAYIIRGVYRKYVYGYRRGYLTKESFYKKRLDKKYNLIDIDQPEVCEKR